ncbi:cancer/testis antigen 55-like isoform X2 [Rattus norvegicus]|uniref:cancer/testis antigen 55-like isoform X2 n=1 Tax=Rattus norvegicus TaxID=10116 RepID=UPI002FD81690
MLSLLRWISTFFHGSNTSEEISEEQPQDNTKLKSIQGVVTSLCNYYGWINDSILFNVEVISDNVPLKIGTNVLALVEQDEVTHTLKAIKVKVMNDLPEGSEPSKLGRRLCIRCVTSVTEEDVYISEDVSFPLYLFSGAFKPFKGDLVLVEYSMNAGTSNINIHSVSPLNSQDIDELEIILAVKTSWGNVECIGFEVFSRLMKAVRSFIVGQPENELKSQEGRA